MEKFSCTYSLYSFIKKPYISFSYYFSISSLHQQEEKVPIWLVGDEDRRFCEYPILRRPGYDYGLSYNNSKV